MNNYNCVHCGLNNWIKQEICKRCKAPNPNLQQLSQSGGYAANVQYGNNFGQPVSPGRTMPNYSVPPPPTAFGNAAGTAVRQNFPQYYSPTPPKNLQPDQFKFAPAYSPEELEKLSAAEKQIKNAWICGAVICAISLLIALLVSAFSSSNAELPVTPFDMLISVVLFGGLTIGVYFKSRACAILLFALFILDKLITIAMTGKFTGVYLGWICAYYLIYGIQGTFTYQRLKKHLI